MKVLVITGSRQCIPPKPDLEKAFEGVDKLIVGDASGVDTAAYSFALGRGMCIGDGSVRMHYAMDHGPWPAAGPRRNAAMCLDAARDLIEGHEVVGYGFPDQESRGTWDCILRLSRIGIAATVIRLDVGIHGISPKRVGRDVPLADRGRGVGRRFGGPR